MKELFKKFMVKLYGKNFMYLDTSVCNYSQPQPPAAVTFEKWMYGRPFIQPLSSPVEPVTSGADKTRVSCPDTHFQCPGTGYCLPEIVRCNGADDCEGREDEWNCDNFTCPGFYRCRGSRICLHPDHVCDGMFQCPQQDDERFCGGSCPTTCTCQGLAFQCTRAFAVENYPDLRYLDAGSSGLSAERLLNNVMLIYLSLKRCNLTSLHLPQLPNLNVLDVSHNAISAVTTEHLKQVSNLKVLLLTGNPLISLFVGNISFTVTTFPRLRVLDVSMVTVPRFNANVLTLFPGLTTLNLSGSATQRVIGELRTLELRVLDMRGCTLEEFPRDLLKNLSRLTTVQSDIYELCCQQTLPEGFNARGCHAPSPVISSCDNLLGSNAQRALVSVLAAVSLLGNGASLIVRRWVVSWRRLAQQSSSETFVSHLSVSNSVMGVYLAVMGVADRVHSGTYLWEDDRWRSSSWCAMSGFLFLLSSQVSVCVVVCMTLDRCAALAWTDGATSRGRATVMCVASWLVGLALAAVPLLSPWNFFPQTSLCIPLPVAHGPLFGHCYAFGVLVVLNVSLMSLTVAGQVYISIMVRRNAMAVLVNNQRFRDLAAARRLMNIAVTDACSWFLAAFLVALASQGESLPDDITPALVAFVVPAKSAVNPVLYVMNVFSERRRQIQTQRLLKRLGDKTAGRRKQGGESSNEDCDRNRK